MQFLRKITAAILCVVLHILLSIKEHFWKMIEDNYQNELFSETADFQANLWPFCSGQIEKVWGRAFSYNAWNGFGRNTIEKLFKTKKGSYNLNLNPPGNKTLWWRRNGVSLYVPATSQVRIKWKTQRRLSGTSPRRLCGMSSRRLIGMSWRRLKGT